jgi:VWFA-related protein
MRTPYVGWIFLLGCFCFPAFSERGAGGGQPGVAANRTITLDVRVSDKSGQPILGLQQEDFTLLDNKQPQKIVSFQVAEAATATGEAPAEVILLVDEVNASFRTVAIEREQIQNFLKQNGGKLSRPVLIVFFSDKETTMSDAASRDGNSLSAGLDQNRNGLRTSGRSQGFYGAMDRLQLSLRTLGQLADHEATRPGRKLVVWISPGWALLSGPNMDLSRKNQEQIFRSIVTLSDQLRRAHITLYNVDPLGLADAGGLRTSYYKEFLKGVRTPNQAQFGNVGLQVLASQSGGLVLNSSNSLTDEIAKCVADVNAYYVLSFEGLPGDGPDDYHTLEIKVDRPGVTARTRAGYYAQP